VRKNFSPQPTPPQSSQTQEAEEKVVIGEISRRWRAEQWLLSVGAVDPDMTPQIFDTLLAFGYREKPVKTVTIEFDRDEENDGLNPKIHYKIRLKPFKRLLYFLSQPVTLLGKFVALFALWMGAPVDIDSRIAHSAVEYLPGTYSVDVEVL
jgi:hypothetical protein